MIGTFERDVSGSKDAAVQVRRARASSSNRFENDEVHRANSPEPGGQKDPRLFVAAYATGHVSTPSLAYFGDDFGGCLDPCGLPGSGTRGSRRVSPSPVGTEMPPHDRFGARGRGNEVALIPWSPGHNSRGASVPDRPAV